MTLVGDILPDFGFTVTSNSTGALAAPSSFAVVLTAPDGSTPTVTVTNPSTGVYAVTYVTTMAGRYRAVGTATGNSCDGVSELEWTVSAADSQLVSVDEALASLRATGFASDAAALEQLDWLCTMATDAVARDLGRKVTRTTVTETHDGGRNHIVLRSGPVLSVTSVTEGGTAVTDYVLDDTAGLLHRGADGYGCWALGRRNVSVTYVAGWTNPPPVLRRVALLLVEQAWLMGQQTPASSFDGASLEGGLAAAVTSMSPVERAAYNSLRAVTFA